MGYSERSAQSARSSERLFANRRLTKRAIALALRYWLRGRLANNQKDMEQAYHTAAAMLGNNPGSAALYLLCAFLCTERNNADEAAAYLETLKPFRASWKASAPFLYGAHLYLQARISLLDGKERAALKHYRTLDKYNESSRVLALDMLLGELDLHMGEWASAYAFLNYASLSGAASPFLYAAAHWYFRNAPAEAPEGALLPAYLRWALTQTLDLTDILMRRRAEISAVVTEQPALGKRLYAAYAPDWVLDALCGRMLDNGDMSETAFYYYKEAEAKQLYSPRLNETLILSAYRNGIESISRYSLTRYLDGGSPDAELKPFIYHLLLTTPEYAPIAARVQNDILQCACYCLESRLAGRMYYSLYRFLLEKAEEGLFTDAALLRAAESTLQRVLFVYEVTVGSPKVTSLWVFEREKKESRAYEVRDGKAYVAAASMQFTAHCFGDGMRTMPESALRRRQLVENADTALYLRFFRAGFTPPELLITLTRRCLALEELPDSLLPVLSAAMSDSSLSRLFRMRAAAALGNHYTRTGDYARAADYYKDLDENALDERDLEQMLLVRIHTRDYTRAAQLIVKKAEYISDRNLFYALKQLTADSGAHNESIADVAYELILKSWYDKTLIAIVLNHYKGSQAEWQALSRALAAMSVSERRLDEIILQNAVTMHMPDAGAQRVFARMCDMDEENPLLRDFALYLSYEIIVNGMTPSHETVERLERLFLRGEEHFIAYALAHVYLAQGTSAIPSESILSRAVRFCEEDGILFPVFKQLKDKSLLTPYIEKHQPFVCHAAPGKQILLACKADGDTAFTEKPMRYVRFGLYMTLVPHFFDETLTYCFVTQMPTGSVSSKEMTVKNSRMHLLSAPGDAFYTLNDALIFEQLFKYDKVEQMITERLAPLPRMKSWIL